MSLANSPRSHHYIYYYVRGNWFLFVLHSSNFSQIIYELNEKKTFLFLETLNVLDLLGSFDAKIKFPITCKFKKSDPNTCV